MNWWKTGFFIVVGFVFGYYVKDNFTEPDSVTNIKDNTKIKKNVDTNIKIKKKWWKKKK